MLRGLTLALFGTLAISTGAPPAALVDVPFELHRNHLLLVRGAIGPLDGMHLLVDTGSGRTIIDSRRAAELKLEGRVTYLESFGARVEAVETRLSSLTLGEYHLGSTGLLAADLSAAARALQVSRLDGIVGIDVLRRTSFGIDYRRRRLLIGPATETPLRVRMTEHPVFVVITADIDNAPMDLIVDTGASHVVLFRPGALQENGDQRRSSAASLTGATAVQAVQLGRIRIGSLLWRNVAAVSVENRGAAAGGPQGLLGPAALDPEFVQFDFERQEVGWKGR